VRFAASRLALRRKRRGARQGFEVGVLGVFGLDGVLGGTCGVDDDTAGTVASMA